MSIRISPRPRFREEDAVALAQDLYGLAASARPLPSERDQNFRLTTSSGESFVLKIAQASERSEELDLQNRALRWLTAHRRALTLPRLCATNSGESVGAVPGPDGSTHFVRMLTYLPGVVLAEARPHSPDLLRSLGRFLGELDLAFQGFSVNLKSRNSKWIRLSLPSKWERGALRRAA